MGSWLGLCCINTVAWSLSLRSARRRPKPRYGLIAVKVKPGRFHDTSAFQMEANMLDVIGSNYLYMVAGAMGVFTLALAFVSLSEFMHPRDR